MIREHFYLELGKLVYAVAVSDGVVQQKEIHEINHSIEEHLKAFIHGKPFPENDFILLTKLSVHNCIREHTSKKVAAQSFLDFFKKHADQINEHERSIAEKLIRRVSSAYHGINKQESNLLEEALSCLKDK